MSPRRRQSPPAATELDRTANELRRRVVSGELAPDTRLGEQVLANDLGVSRHTVRRALERMLGERLLTAEPYRGVRVAKPDDEAVRALQQLRGALESEAVRLLLERYPDRWPVGVSQPIEEALVAMEGAAGADPALTDRAHSHFHQALVDAAGSPRISEAYAGLDAEMQIFVRQLRPAYTPKTLAAEHRAYLDDLRERGPVAVRLHLSRSTELLLDLRSTRPPGERRSRGGALGDAEGVPERQGPT